MHRRNQLPLNPAFTAMRLRQNARASTGQLEPVFAKPPTQSPPPENQNILGAQVQLIDRLQYEYRSFVFEMSPNQVSDADSLIIAQQLIGKSRRRRYLFIQNNSPNADIYLSFGNGTTDGLTDYIVVPKNTSLELPFAPNNEVTIFAKDITLIVPQPQAVVSVLVGNISE